MNFSLKHITAQVISYLFHPGILPTIGVVYILFVVPQVIDISLVFRITGIVFLGTYVGPMFGTILLRWTGIISSIHLVKKEERIYPYLTAAASMLATANFLARNEVPMEVTFSILASAVVVFASTIALPFFKSSAHMAGIAGFIALYLRLFDFYNQGSLLVVIALS
ncbi:MAG TPA: hypothetical protein DHU80_07030, partial [Cryomorphaceae bacterium]|nr:hypothetical protein [Cryomorphaceae bacterium]